ncbi:hypothetical protein Tco_1384861 [Tanacetum coccineum]
MWVGSDNVDVNTDEVVADEDVDLAGNNVFVADKKSVLVDENVDFCEKNYVFLNKRCLLCSDAKRDESGDADMNNCTDIPKFAADADNNVSISDRDDLEKKIHDVQVLDNVVCVDRTKDVYGSEAKTSAADYVVIKEFGSDNVDVNTNDVVADEDVDLACSDGKRDESGDIDLNNCPDIPNFAADADSNELIAHGLINRLKLDYGGIIFNDLAAKLNNSVHHPSPAYARFISLILEKALGDNYVISEEIDLKIPLMGNSIFNLEPTSSEVPITCHMDRVCKSVSEACLVSEDVAGLDLCDNVYDGSPSEDAKFNEIIQNVKTKTMSSLLDPNSIATTDVYQYKVVTNVLNEDVIGESAIPSGSCDHNLKDDFHGKANEISDCLNEEVIDQSAINSGTGDQNLKDDCPGKANEISDCLSEEVVYQSAIPSGSDDQNLKDNCPGKTIDISNCLSEEVIDQSAIPSGSGDHNLKDDCFEKVNEVSNCLNQEVIVETIIPTSHLTLKFVYIGFQVFIFLGSDDHNLKVDCHVNSNEVSNIQNHVESDNQLQSESNVYAFMLSKQVSPGQSIENLIYGGDDIMNVDCDDESENEGNHRAFKDVVQAYPNLSEFNGLTEQVRLLTNQVTSLVTEQQNLKDQINKLHTSSTPSTESFVAEVVKGVTTSLSSVSVEINGLTSVQKDLKDEINELKKSSSSKSSRDQVMRDVISAIQPELKSIKEHIISIQIPSFPSKESLVAEFVKCIEASNSSLSKDVTELSAKHKELVDEVNKLGNSSLPNTSIDDISKAVAGLIKPELESFIKSVTDSFLKTKVNINVPEDILRVGESMKNLSNSVSSVFSIVNTITQRLVQLSPEFATLPKEIQRFRSSVNDIVTFKVEIRNLAKNNHENVSMFKQLSVNFSNLQKAVNDFENYLVESVPSKEERMADQQLMEVISINQALIKANISKISDSMLVLMKWGKSIFVDGPLSNNQETTSSVLSEKYVPKGDPQGQTSLHVEVEAIHSTSVKTDSHQNVGPDLSITKFESCENVTVSPTPLVVSEKYVVPGDPHGQTSSHVEVEAVHSSSIEINGHQNVYPESSGVKYLMTPEEIAKQKDDEEIIKRKNQEEKASYAKIVNVLAEDERNLHIHRVSAIRDEEDHNLEVKYKNRKILYDKYVRALNPQCRNHLEKITAVDIISRKGPVCVTIYRASLMVIKAHTPLKLSDFNYFEWLEIQKCVSTKKNKQAQVILENIKVRINELRRIKQTLGIIPGVPLSELDPMIEFHDLMNKRKLDEREMEGSFVAGMKCDLSLPFELENKKHVDGQVVYEPEYRMLFRNSYMHRCFIRVKDLCKCSLERLYLIKGMYYHTHTDSSATSIEKEFIRFCWIVY